MKGRNETIRGIILFYITAHLKIFTLNYWNLINYVALLVYKTEMR